MGFWFKSRGFSQSVSQSLTHSLTHSLALSLSLSFVFFSYMVPQTTDPDFATVPGSTNPGYYFWVLVKEFEYKLP